MEIDSFDPKGKKFLAISAHSDDADFCAGGTLLKWIEQGAKGAVVICTNGDKGSHNKNLTHEHLEKIRKEEQLEASRFLGLEKTWFLDHPDAELENTIELRKELVKIIREYKPDIVFSFDPTMSYSLEINYINHPDHRAVGQAALDSVYPLARDFLVFPEHKELGLGPHCVCDVFIYNYNEPNFYVDITDFMDKKKDLLNKHSSQYKESDLDQFVTTLNGKKGEACGVKFAEGFVHINLHPD